MNIDVHRCNDEKFEFSGLWDVPCYRFSLKFNTLKSVVGVFFYKPWKRAKSHHNFLKSHHNLYLFFLNLINIRIE
jgi:hypothetical protein